MSDGHGTARSRLTREQARAQTRRRLLDAAAVVFAARGYERASVEEIAETAGFSHGAVYANFAGKQSLFSALMTERAVEHAAEIRAVLDETGPGSVRRHALGQVVTRTADKDVDGAALQAEFWLWAVRNPDSLEEFVAARRQATREVSVVVADQLERMPRADGLPDGVSVEYVATMAMALFEGLVNQRRVDPGSVPDEMFGLALRWMFRGLAQEGSGTRHTDVTRRS